MNNLKKLGLTALAGSLVATSVSAADLSVTGSASMDIKNRDHNSSGRSIGMGNSVNFAGSGETDGGLSVSMAFELDQGAANNSSNGFDNHSVTISSDAMGSFSLSGHGGSSAASALDTTAAGDIFDNFDATAGILATEIFNGSKAGNNIMKYTLPSMVDGLAVAVSYQAGGNSNAGAGSSTAYGLTYTGVEGLTVSYGYGEDNDTNTDEREVTTIAAAYAYGPVTVAYTESENDATTASTDQKLKSVAVSYTISENLSVKYGQETFENQADAVDPEYTSFSAAYTSGGMTVSVGQQKAEDADGDGTDDDVEYNYLTLGFAF